MKLFNKLNLFINHYLMAVLCSLAVFLVTILGFVDAKFNAYERRIKQFEYLTDQAYNSLKNKLEDCSQVLNGAKGLFAADENVTRSAWKAYVKELQVKKYYPGIQGIGFSKYILHNQLKNYIDQIRAEGRPEYTIKPEGSIRDHALVLYFESFKEPEGNIFGYDMLSEPVRRQALEHARDTRQLTLSGKIELVREKGPSHSPGFLLILPVYQNGQEPETIAERKKLLKGFVYCPYGAKDIIRSIWGNQYNDINIEIFDGDSLTQESLIFHNDKTIHFFKPENQKLRRLKKLNIGGREWSICFSAKAGFGSTSDNNQPLIIALGGSLIGILLFFTISAFSNTRIHAITIAEETTQLLMESEQQIQNIFKNAPDAVIVINKEGNVIKWNPKAEKLFGWSEIEMIGKSLSETIVPPKYREAHERGIKHFLATGEGPVLNKTVEMTALTKTNAEFDIALSISNTIEHGSPIFIAFISDITQRKQAELNIEQKTKELERSNSELQQFASVASHDLKEPLRKIQMFGSMLYTICKNVISDEGLGYITRMQSSATRMGLLIEDLLSFSKIGMQQEYFQVVNLNEIISDILIDLEVPILQTNAEIRVDIIPSLKVVPSQMRQLFQNLISNALKFTKKDQAAIISITSKIIDGSMVEGMNKRSSKEKFCEITIKDNGIGFSEKYAEKVFVIFQRLHNTAEYEGTGIGLSICKKIIDYHNGAITVHSSEDHGTSFIVTIPVL